MRLTLRELRPIGPDLEFVYLAAHGEDRRTVVVRIRDLGGRFQIEFPHVSSSGGESLGNPALDEEMRRRVEATIQLLEAVAEWQTWRAHR